VVKIEVLLLNWDVLQPEDCGTEVGSNRLRRTRNVLKIGWIVGIVAGWRVGIYARCIQH
jgi:hypothetical protein